MVSATYRVGGVVWLFSRRLGRHGWTIKRPSLFLAMPSKRPYGRRGRGEDRNERRDDGKDKRKHKFSLIHRRAVDIRLWWGFWPSIVSNHTLWVHCISLLP
jgi:hypothetical protein